MRKYILLIDDDEEELQIFSEALGEIQKPMSCVQSRTSSAALSLLSYMVPDYIFLDINFAGIDGFECLEEIKKMEIIDKVPAILYSNWVDGEIQKKAIEKGASACIKKPNTLTALAEILKEVFSNDLKLTPLRLPGEKSI